MILAEAEPQRFHSLNAKYMPPEAVAETFIPPPQWKLLCMNGHTLLVGSRGAGKTTLLKMLQPRALSSWRHDDAPDAMRSIGFTGVFITADRNWSEQVSALGSRLAPEHQTVLGLVTFTTHVLYALAGAAADRVHGPAQFRHVNISTEDEALLVRDTARSWAVREPVATLRGLRQAMSDRINHIAAFALSESLRPEIGRAERLADTLPFLDYVTASLTLIERFNDYAGEPDALWCLLLDELELAPPSVTTQLQRGLRGTDARLLFKLSLAPYTQGAEVLRRALSGQQAHDFHTVVLSYPHKTDGYDFCRRLLAARLGVAADALDEEAVLSRSEFEAAPTDRSPTSSAYAPGGRQLRRLRDLARGDASFRAWLADHKIDLDRPIADGTQRASTLRKITSVATVRAAYRNTDAAFEKTHRRRRTRKNPDLFTGATSLYAMAEGNPRWFMNLIQPLIDEGGRAQVPPNRQAAQIRDVMRLFRAVLTAIPLPPSAAGRRKLGVLPVLDAIGMKLSQQLVDDDFNAEPPGKFRIDGDVPDEVVEDLQFALNVGGIVHVPAAGEAEKGDVLFDLRGKTFRLAYLLAPGYPTTLTAGRALDLSSILREREPSWDLSDQLRLGDDASRARRPAAA